MSRPGILACVIMFAVIVSCGLPHQHRGTSFITDPELEMFGANLEKSNGWYFIKSYFQSSIIGRTEYIYENLDIEIPDTATAGSVFVLPGPGIKIKYSRGGEGGQIGTMNAKGTVAVIDVLESGMRLRCDLEFTGFTASGHTGPAPGLVKRKGILTAKKGYRLY